MEVCLYDFSKSFEKKLIDRQTVSFISGQIYGIVGENGCGKTVFFKCVCGLMQLTTGYVEVRDKDRKLTQKPIFGVVIDGAGFVNAFSGKRNLMMLANIKGKVTEKQVDDAMKRVELDPNNRKKVSYYSLGMRQRLALAQALMEDPPVLLLDEPLNGLDVEGTKLVYRILEAEKEKGKVILIASHHVEDIKLLCDKAFWLKDGKLIQLRDMSEYTAYRDIRR